MLVDTRAASTFLNLKRKGVMDKRLLLLSTTPPPDLFGAV
jgi:hypothetical protein